MFAPERIRMIKGILLDRRHIDVASLSTMLRVSEVTIRRDLEKLEKENFLTRTHGGAIINETPDDLENQFAGVQDDPYIDERIEISDIAFHMIDDNDIILLSSGLTNLHIAKKISGKKNVTVLTNDLNIVSELSTNANNKVIVPGGDLELSSMTLVGTLTVENLRKLFVNKAFIEVEGVDMRRGYTVQGIEKASIIKEMFNITHQKVIVCPYTAFDNIAFSQIGPIDIANRVITNPKIPDQYKNYYFENNIQLFTAFNSYEGGI